ncbi:MAG: 16S rRNA pseudouridine(516) synthase [Pseudomonadales bacterium]|nr:16S rRNA pseudouridine(516) synthase [Pseudomonadales bacterium]
MKSKQSRLDRFISARLGIKRSDVRLMLAQGRVEVDGLKASSIHQVVGAFSLITFDGDILQNKVARYVMLNKPKGIVSATKDDTHKTVVDLLNCDDRDELHIVGRLDFNSTGLLLLTNDGQWSKGLMAPEKKVVKRYSVTLANPVTEEMKIAFKEGMYFAYEDITTRPAELIILENRNLKSWVVEVRLVEGRYHQIKRMFGRFQNEVIELHRLAIGELELDSSLAMGESRWLTESEVKFVYG